MLQKNAVGYTPLYNNINMHNNINTPLNNKEMAHQVTNSVVSVTINYLTCTMSNST
jgi:hypothetical protein